MKQLYSHLFNYFWPLASVICLKKELFHMKDMDGKNSIKLFLSLDKCQPYVYCQVFCVMPLSEKVVIQRKKKYITSFFKKKKKRYTNLLFPCRIVGSQTGNGSIYRTVCLFQVSLLP